MTALRLAPLLRPAIIALSLLLASAGLARAQSCSFTASDMVLGPVDVLGGSPTDAVGNIAISCSAFLGLLSSIDMRIHLGEGMGGLGGGLRRMTSAGTSTGLGFELYQDAARSVVFGGSYGSHGGQSLRLAGASILTLLTGSGMNVPVYARVPTGQNTVVPGNYASAFSRNPLDVRVDYRTCNILLLCVDRTATFSFTVRGQVVPDCRVEADDLDFGTVGLLDQPVDASSQIRVTCTAGSSYDLGLGYGLHGGGVNDRHMQDLAGNRIGYQLYRDSGRTLGWGQPADGLATTAAGSGAMQSFTVHGRVPAQPTPPPGAYADTVVVTVTY
ncbi:spore coat protein U domain-containing protein [Paracoccus sp. TOH]|uniref:Csu type fimbrial protein n=1 Tax=Paracoccus sp. TOH TaxID=1263728 RepID=UPI0025B20F65|nr:spore coat protein U domain-containing protein [Paracoccus sp. TOH]WJS86521.1 spore coat U domain-containing protein [Paracoccus sp. TOH]